MLPQPDAQAFANWPEAMKEEILANWNNRNVGSRIVSETDDVRIWHLELKPGERAPFHRHDESYFWTVQGPGTARSHYNDGRVVDVTYEAGETKHFDIPGDEFFVHDLANTGDTPLFFVTVEFKRKIDTQK